MEVWEVVGCGLELQVWVLGGGGELIAVPQLGFVR